MPTWKDDLARRIADLKDEDWDVSPLHVPTGDPEVRTVLIRIKEFEAIVPAMSQWRVMELAGKINDLPFCGAPANSLLIAGGTGEAPFRETKLRIVLRSEPWNHLYDLRAGGFRPLIDLAGQMPYALADFDADLPG